MTKRRRFLLSSVAYWAMINACLFTSLACEDRTHREECDLYIAPEGFTPEELEIVVESVEEWNVAANGVVVLHPVIGRAPAWTSFPHTLQAATPEWEKDFPNNTGVTVDHDTIYLHMLKIRDIDPTSMDTLKHTTLHELGHHLGMDHEDSEPWAIMVTGAEWETLGTCIHLTDARRFCELYSGRCKEAYSTCSK